MVREILQRERAWALYALGDLDEGRSRHAEWRVDEKQSGLVLFYREFGTPVLFTMGEPAVIGELLRRGEPVAEAYLQIRPEVLDVIGELYEVVWTKRMMRMEAEQRVAMPEGTRRLGAGDVGQLEALYADGKGSGEMPDFFFPAMVGEGVFHAVWEAGELVAAAGTHLVSEGESVGAVGNVYTRRDRRGRGLGERVTRAVVAELQQMGVRTVGLNVALGNAAARRVYRRVGFAERGEFLEGLARGRKPKAAEDPTRSAAYHGQSAVPHSSE